MNVFLNILGVILQYSRPALFVAALLVAAACAVSWATRTRRISPFTPLGRFAREKVDPYLRSVEGPVLNAGGSPTMVPWWGLAAFIVLGILAQSLLGYLIGVIGSTAAGLASGPRGALRALVQLTFSVLQIALMIRVLSSWFGALSRARWLRWTYTVTEPLLAPLRAVIPALGPFDITPLILCYLINIVGGFIVSSI
jgi:YggT family protein